MTQTVLERAGEQIAETVEKASRTTANIGKRLYEQLDETKIVAKRGVRAAEELLDDTRSHIKKHPATSVAGAFVAGLLLGAVAGWMIRRK
jgi:ElaB/YqjD/DUF883 family membrane-anchored ribosome-binding protein